MDFYFDIIKIEFGDSKQNFLTAKILQPPSFIQALLFFSPGLTTREYLSDSELRATQKILTEYLSASRVPQTLDNFSKERTEKSIALKFCTPDYSNWFEYYLFDVK